MRFRVTISSNKTKKTERKECNKLNDALHFLFTDTCGGSILDKCNNLIMIRYNVNNKEEVSIWDWYEDLNMMKYIDENINGNWRIIKDVTANGKGVG